MASVMHRSSSDGGSSSGWSDAAAAVAAAAEEERAGWEVRPSGMVVQARDDAVGPGDAPPRPPPPEIKVRVKYGGARHEVSVSPIATFGELLHLLLGLALHTLRRLSRSRSRLFSSLSLKPL